MTFSTDRIEKRALLRAPQERVWNAISNSVEFGSWFGMELDGPFRPGTQITGRIRPTQVDPTVAKLQESYAGTPVAFFVDRIKPMTMFSFRWHPFAVDKKADYSGEPMTLVTFALEPAEDGTLLTLTESGFDSIPIQRRAAAFEANDGGWSAQMQLIEKHLQQTP